MSSIEIPTAPMADSTTFYLTRGKDPTPTVLYADIALTAQADWEPDARSDRCELCSTQFTLFNRRHHCRRCGQLVCAECCPKENNSRICLLCVMCLGSSVDGNSLKLSILFRNASLSNAQGSRNQVISTEFYRAVTNLLKTDEDRRYLCEQKGEIAQKMQQIIQCSFGNGKNNAINEPNPNQSERPIKKVAVAFFTNLYCGEYEPKTVYNFDNMIGSIRKETLEMAQSIAWLLMNLTSYQCYAEQVAKCDEIILIIMYLFDVNSTNCNLCTLNIVCNLIRNSEEARERIVSKNIINIVEKLIKSDDSLIRTTALKVCSHLSKSQIQQVEIDAAQLMQTAKSKLEKFSICYYLSFTFYQQFTKKQRKAIFNFCADVPCQWSVVVVKAINGMDGCVGEEELEKILKYLSENEDKK